MQIKENFLNPSSPHGAGVIGMGWGGAGGAGTVLEHSPKSPPLLQNKFEDLHFIFKIYAVLKFHSIICNIWLCFNADILDIK